MVKIKPRNGDIFMPIFHLFCPNITEWNDKKTLQNLQKLTKIKNLQKLTKNADTYHT